MKRNPAILSCLLTLAAASHSAHAFNIMVNYSYDSNDFFDQAMSKAAMQAAADRFSTVPSSVVDDLILLPPLHEQGEPKAQK